MKIKLYGALSLLLALLILLPVFASCSGKGSGEETQSTSAQQTSAPAETRDPSEVLDIPEGERFDGYTLNILLTSYMTNMSNPFTYTDTTKVIDEAVYTRNELMAEKYGISISTIEDFSTAGNTGTNRIIANHSAGDCAYDICVLGVFDTSKLAYQNYLYDLQDMPYIDLTKVWWDQAATEEVTIYGQTFYTAGDISYVDKEYTFSVIFNKTIAAEKNIPDLYALVESGGWTIDKLAEYSMLVSDDLDGNGKYDSNDRYGIMIWDATLTTMINGAGQRITSIVDDSLTLTLNNEKTLSVIDKYVDLAEKQCTINFQHMTGGVSWGDMYTNGQVLFLIEYLKALNTFRDTELDFGILPIPKLTEDQDEYYCDLAGYQTALFCIPAIINDDMRIGYLTEAMAYYSKQLVTPAFYEKTLVGRTVRDDESVGMLDIIFENRVFDLGLFYKIGTYSTQLSSMLASKNKGFAAIYDQYKSIAESNLTGINEAFEKNKK